MPKSPVSAGLFGLVWLLKIKEFKKLQGYNVT
jgi:hypothetical protein